MRESEHLLNESSKCQNNNNDTPRAPTPYREHGPNTCTKISKPKWKRKGRSRSTKCPDCTHRVLNLTLTGIVFIYKIQTRGVDVQLLRTSILKSVLCEDSLVDFLLSEGTERGPITCF